jgi:DNA-binding transcriptional regulator YiaG
MLPEGQSRGKAMPNIAVTFRQEITRLARREIRTEIRGLKRASAQYRKDIAGLKRRVSELQAEAARIERQLPKGVVPKVAEAEAKGVRFSAGGLRSNRQRLGLSAASYAKLVGVSEQTIYNWERGVRHPLRHKLAVLSALRGIGKRDAHARLEQSGQKPTKGRSRAK